MPFTITMTGPGTTTLADDTAAVLTTQMPLLIAALNAHGQAITGNATYPFPAVAGQPFAPGTLGAIDADLAMIAKNMSSINDISKNLTTCVSDLNAAIGAMACTTNVGNSLQASLVANQIKTNNFQVAATKEALVRTGQPEPVVPTIKEQLTESVKDSITLTETAVAQGAVLAQATASLADLGTWITKTSVYQGAEEMLKKAKTWVTNQIWPPSVKTVTDGAILDAGIKKVGETA